MSGEVHFSSNRISFRMAGGGRENGRPPITERLERTVDIVAVGLLNGLNSDDPAAPLVEALADGAVGAA